MAVETELVKVGDSQIRHFFVASPWLSKGGIMPGACNHVHLTNPRTGANQRATPVEPHSLWCFLLRIFVLVSSHILHFHSYYHLLQTFPLNYCVLKSGRALKAPFPLCASCRGKT